MSAKSYRLKGSRSVLAPAAHQATQHGFAVLADRRLLAGRLVVEHRLHRTLESVAVLRAPVLQRHSDQPARREWQPQRLHRLRSVTSDGRAIEFGSARFRWASVMEPTAERGGRRPQQQ